MASWGQPFPFEENNGNPNSREEPGRKEERVDSMKWNWEELANGIVLQAVKDYRASRRRARKRKTAREARMRIREVEKFFHSRWFCQLTVIDGEKLPDLSIPGRDDLGGDR